MKRTEVYVPPQGYYTVLCFSRGYISIESFLTFIKASEFQSLFFYLHDLGGVPIALPSCEETVLNN